jgi:hypothetical protein
MAYHTVEAVLLAGFCHALPMIDEEGKKDVSHEWTDGRRAKI